MFTIFFEDPQGYEGQMEYSGTWFELQLNIKELRKEGYTNIEAVNVEN